MKLDGNWKIALLLLAGICNTSTEYIRTFFRACIKRSYVQVLLFKICEYHTIFALNSAEPRVKLYIQMPLSGIMTWFRNSRKLACQESGVVCVQGGIYPG